MDSVPNLKLGFFRSFKSCDTVLLSGGPSDIVRLVHRLRIFVDSGEQSLPIHTFATVSSKHPATLFATQLPQALAPGFGWLCTQSGVNNILPMLEGLLQCTAGHQYFDLVETSAHLMVSVGEYGDAWWQSHA